MAEEGSDEVRAAMAESDWVTSRLTFVESLRAIALAQGPDSAPARAFVSEWDAFDIVELSDEVARSAAALALQTGLRSLDAVHLASAESQLPAAVELACFDHRLRDVARERGLRLRPA